MVEINPNAEQKNILTIIEKTDEILSRQGTSYQIMPHYEMLCDMAHPNTGGFQRYLVSVEELEDGWTARLMQDCALGTVAGKILRKSKDSRNQYSLIHSSACSTYFASRNNCFLDRSGNTIKYQSQVAITDYAARQTRL